MSIYGERITTGIINKHLYSSDETGMRQHGILRNVLYKIIKDLMVVEEELRREAFHVSCLLHLNSGNVLAVMFFHSTCKARQGPLNNIIRH